MGLDPQKVGSIIENATPIAEAIGAMEVYRLHRILSASGFTLKAEPNFQWDLDDNI